MLKLNLAISETGQRLVVLGLSHENIRRLRKDEPVAFTGEQILLNEVSQVMLIWVRDVGHFLTTVSKGLRFNSKHTQEFIDSYRVAIKQRKANQWSPWAVSRGADRGVSCLVACGLLVEEVMLDLEYGKVVVTEAKQLGVPEGSRLVMYARETEEGLEQTLLDEILPECGVSPEAISVLRGQFDSGSSKGSFNDFG